MWIWLHLITWIVLVGVILTAIVQKKTTRLGVTIARICYVVAIISGIMLTGYAWQHSPVLTVFKILLAIGTIGFCEIFFSQTDHFSATKRWLLLAVIFAVGVVGLFLAGGYPFVR
ncbi:MAG: YisL family protein [Liquorilactobacillus nagelii]|jgi:hypothetical protein|uniref:DUF1516 family protein n=1 Tax=Liquorilactobacillus nagelii TaxID=82688 RepID=UPI002430E9AC|nr:DUF1516 family protein [Liquorilactobacillus nagelii]MCI1921622.1 YisL family protein [Liquorilactobacillus nagelii]MCI1977252.1 YisL family protein [Liquorilactobacillus nagelii]